MPPKKPPEEDQPFYCYSHKAPCPNPSRCRWGCLKWKEDHKPQREPQ